MLHTMDSRNTRVHRWIIMTGESVPCPSKINSPGYRLKVGDRVIVWLKSNNPGGHHVAIVRHFTLTLYMKPIG